MTTAKTITLKSYRRYSESPIEKSFSTRAKITIAPPAGQQFTPQGMEQAGKEAAITGFAMAAAFLRELPADARYCIPSVEGGDTWAGAATAVVTFEHSGDRVLIATLQQVVAQASK